MFQESKVWFRTRLLNGVVSNLSNVHETSRWSFNVGPGNCRLGRAGVAEADLHEHGNFTLQLPPPTSYLYSTL
jgi:hypothetical protein